jgi:hypothetical protein
MLWRITQAERRKVRAVERKKQDETERCDKTRYNISTMVWSGNSLGLHGPPPSSLSLLQSCDCMQGPLVWLMRDLTSQSLSQLLAENQYDLVYMMRGRTHTCNTFASLQMTKVIISLFTRLGGVTAPLERM